MGQWARKSPSVISFVGLHETLDLVAQLFWSDDVITEEEKQI